MTAPSGNGTPGDLSAPADRVSPSSHVAARLAALTNRSVVDLDPLAESVDPDALDAIFARTRSEHAAVTFCHEGYQVTVTGAGDVRIKSVTWE